MPPGAAMNVAYLDFAKKLMEQSNGRIKITGYETTVGTGTEGWEQCSKNVMQLVQTSTGWNPGRMPIDAMVELPYVLSDVRVASRVLVEFLKVGYLKEITDNFKVIAFTPIEGFSLILRDKKVTRLEDIKGLKVKAIPGPNLKSFELFGATTVNLPGSEEYMALSTGIVDGVSTGATNMVDKKLYEVSKYALKTHISSGTFAFIMNKQTWESLPMNLQTLIDKLGQEMTEAHANKQFELMQNSWKTLSDKGVEVYALDSAEEDRFKTTSQVIIDNYVKEWSDKGYPAQEAFKLMQTVAGSK
jgi:C4-dicarboxylate-binding protein DctP